MSIVILRPSLIYGRYVKGNLEKLIRFIKKNKLFSFPNTFNKRSMIHVENLIDGILLCCKTKENFKIYNINDNKNRKF